MSRRDYRPQAPFTLVQERVFNFFSQLKRYSYHCRAAAEGVVVGIGVDAVEEGVGVAALVEEVLATKGTQELPLIVYKLFINYFVSS